MAEADELCERVAIVDRGRILAIGTPAELKRRVQRESIFRLELEHFGAGPRTLADLPGVLKASAATASDTGNGDGTGRDVVGIKLVLAEDSALSGVVQAVTGMGAEITALEKSEPSLEDVFVELVGRGFAESEAGETSS
jgi:ABC-2 type transport system ATP-binding protein